jgi:hypothetical protein
MMDVRIVAILVGVAITFTLQNGLDTRWYVSVPAGFIGYFAAALSDGRLTSVNVTAERSRETQSLNSGPRTAAFGAKADIKSSAGRGRL